MKKLKYFILVLVILSGLIFLFSPEVIPDNFQFQELLDLAKQSDIIIIFNSGGWGNTPFEEAKDFTPIIEGIQKALNEWGYNSIVVPYKRTKDNFFGKIAGTKDFLSSFEFSSKILAKEMEFLVEKLPDKKIILAGLSAGGAFVDETMEKIEAKASVYAIEAGVPFWVKPSQSENILQLDNGGKDSLSKGNIKELVLGLVKSSFKWILAKISGKNLSLSRITNQFIGHAYEWNTVAPEITSFLENKISSP